jgi:hypothetical protein
LLREGWAPTLLLSVGRFEIRRFASLELPGSVDLPALASSTEPRRRHYFVTVASGTAEAQRIGVGRFGTLNEIRAFSDWLRAHRLVRSATIVSSGFHLKRIRMCCRGLMAEDIKLNFVAVPDEGRYLRAHWWRDPGSRKLLLSEVVKIALYWLIGHKLFRGPRLAASDHNVAMKVHREKWSVKQVSRW